MFQTITSLIYLERRGLADKRRRAFLVLSLLVRRCRCLNTSKSVKIALITQLKLDEPRPYCNRREVIVTLKNGSERCLDPQSKFTIMLLEKL
uniref:Chemokine interleukin-8-like domain-containing protein n=1 Tax=Maylandia zebra TaxID=106582 RepID=A0A3P9D1I0_9CICH